MRARLLVVEGRTRGGGFIRSGLESEGYRVDVAADTDEALMFAELQPYHAILLDVTAPSADGPAVVRQFRRRGVAAPLLILSAEAEAEDRVLWLDAGADDCLTQPVSIAELVARLRALSRRERPRSGNILRVADLDLNRITRKAARGGADIKLTRREFALLELLLRASPHPVGKAEIIERVWKRRIDPETNAVNVYVNSLRRKIDREGFQPLIHTVRGAGFCCRELL
jgi:DNA-binding response OmpR family regulator